MPARRGALIPVMRELRVVLLSAVMAACGSSESPNPLPPPSHPVTPTGGSNAAAVSGLSDKEALARVQEIAHGVIGKTAVADAPVPEGSPQLIAATEPCKRPPPPELEKITATLQTLLKAADHEYGTVLLNGVGCVEPSGVIVNAQADVLDKPGGREVHGNWWVVRVNGAKLEVLSDISGPPLAYFSEWTQERTADTVALADVDGDGKLDAVIEHVAHEGGSMRNYIDLSIVTGGGVKKDLASFSDNATMVGTALPLVLRIDNREAVTYRCIDKSLAFGPCAATGPALRKARAHDRAQQIVDAPPGLPDRDTLADDLELFDVPEAERAQLLASAAPTDPATRAARHVAKFVSDRDGDVLPEQRNANRDAEQKAFVDGVRVALGDTPCIQAADKATTARMKAWVTANDRATTMKPEDMNGCPPGPDCRLKPATEIVVSKVCTGAAGTYAFVSWSRPSVTQNEMFGVAHEAIVFTPAKGGADTTLISGEASGLLVDGPAIGPRASASIDAAFYKRGDQIVAAITDDKHKLTVFADGKHAASFSMPVTWYDLPDRVALLRVDVPDGGYMLVHAEPDVKTIVTMAVDPLDPNMPKTTASSEAARLLLGHAQELAAWERLSGVGDSVGDPEGLSLALSILKAPAALIAEVKK